MKEGACKKGATFENKRKVGLPMTTWNETLAGAILDGAHWYWPESSGDTLGSDSVSRSESLSTRSSTVVLPFASVAAEMIALFSAPPECESRTSRMRHFHGQSLISDAENESENCNGAS